MATQAMSSALQAGASAVTNSKEAGGTLSKLAPSGVVGQAEALERAENSQQSAAHMMRTVRVVGSALIGIAVLVVVLNEVFSLEAIAGTEGEFSDVTDQLTSIGGAALGLMVIGILVLAANRVMGFFGSGF